MEKKIPYDHKKIGKRIKLFFFYKNLNTGLPIWLPYGIYIYNKIKNFIKKINIINKYNEVVTPNIGNYSLYKLSGHLDKYLKNIFKIEYKKKIFLNPMNCPYHCLIYKFYNNISYKELPIKFYEFGTVFRNEKSGELNGLFRTKVFTQDDGHIFCKDIKEIVKEIDNIINIILLIYKKFNLKNYYIRLSLRDKNYIKNEYIGEKKNWIKSEKVLINIIKKRKINYNISYGDAAFYGPKIDFIIKDSFNRSWQLSTIQIDYNTPKRFDLKYVDSKNRLLCPVMIHRAFLGSIERFIGILIEHYKGFLPVWLLKIQIVIIPIYINHYKYCKLIFNYLIKKKVRCIIDNSSNNLNKKIKKFEKINIPIMLIIGEKEKVENRIFLRIKNKKNKNLKIKDAFKYILEYINNN